MASAYDLRLEGNNGIDHDAEAREARIEQLVREFSDNPAKRAEADSWTAGTLDYDHYAAVETALADLDEVEPSALATDGVLTRLYRLAKVHGEARRAKLRELAEAAYEDEQRANDRARAESAMDRRAAA